MLSQEGGRDFVDRQSVLDCPSASMTSAASQSIDPGAIRASPAGWRAIAQPIPSTRLDGLVEQHGLEKIKTSGDAYMVVGGVPEALEDHAGKIAALALDARKVMSQVINPLGQAMSVRIGIATGTVVSGVVGKKKFFYDVWGDAVNVASRMETTAEPGEIEVSASTFALLRDRFEFRERGAVDVRGKGTMRTWYLSGVLERSMVE